MNTIQDLYYDIEQMYIDGVNARRISQILECDIQEVHRVLEHMGVCDQAESYDPFLTFNS
jgi:hypothetical protein